MAGYVLTGITILHPEAYEYYQRQVPAVIVKYDESSSEACSGLPLNSWARRS